MRLFIIVLALFVALPAAAQENPLKAVDLSKYQFDRAKETPLQAGQRLLEDLKAANPAVAANLLEAARYEIQKDETEKFARQSGSVMWAYGVAWAVLALFAAGLFGRQRRLARELEELEARVRVEKT
jgi:CcmD family protein